MAECTATHVKKTYLKFRRRIHNNYRPHKRWKKSWQKIADLVNRLGCDIADYIAAQFAETYPFPHPNMMYSQKAIDKYNAYAQKEINNVGKFEEEINNRFTFMTNLLEQKMELGLDIKLILKNEAFTFTPLFRVAIFYSTFKDIEPIKEYIWEAKNEYYSHPAYAELYGEYVDWRAINELH